MRADVSRAQIEGVKSVLSMAVLLDRYSTHSDARGRRWSCINPTHDDNDPSLYVKSYSDGGEGARCFVCDWSGDVINLIETAEGLTRGEAMSRARELAGQPRLVEQMATRRRATPAPTKSELVLDLDPLRPPAPDADRALRAFCEHRGWRHDVALEFGLSAVLDKRGRGLRVRFPFTVAGEIVYYQDRATWSNAKKGERWMSPSGGSAPVPFGVDRLSGIDRATGKTEVFILEGPSDALAFASIYPLFPVLAVPGASSFNDDWTKPLEGLDVFICTDPDEAGGKLRTRIDQAFKGRRPHHFHVPPTYSDLDDWRLNDLDGFEAVLFDILEEAYTVRDAA